LFVFPSHCGCGQRRKWVNCVWQTDRNR
jgi:hypothetical protein